MENHQKTLLITGATGFIGRALCARLMEARRPLRKVIRTCSNVDCTEGTVVIPNIDGHTSWTEALLGCHTVVHLAACVHHAHTLNKFLLINVNGSLNLARQAAVAGVKRFVFVSSIAVNGASSPHGMPFTLQSPLNPVGNYGISKMEAEKGLRKIAAETGMEVVIIRPPIVYGSGVKANFFYMMRWIHSRIPLPLGCLTTNSRSIVALDNFVDLLYLCIDHPAAANQTFMVSDNENLSTCDLLRRLGKAMGCRVWLLKVPPALLRVGAKILGRDDLVRRLISNLEIDITHTLKTLGWVPPISVDEGLRRAANGFYESVKTHDRK